MTTPHLPAIPEPPYPEDFTYVIGYEMGPYAYFVTTEKSYLGCNLCRDKVADHTQMPEWGTDEKKVREWVARMMRFHFRAKHPEKLHVYTEVGWLPVGWLTRRVTEKGD
jgi:hypothetical protein